MLIACLFEKLIKKVLYKEKTSEKKNYMNVMKSESK